MVILYRIAFPADTKGFPLKYEHLSRGTQRPNVSKYTRSVSDGFLYTLEACLVNLELSLKKTIYLFGCLRGTLVVTKVLVGFFVSSERVSYPYGSGRKFEDMKYVFSLYRKF